MSDDRHGNDPGWAPMPVDPSGGMGTHASELTPLGDVHSQAPQAYDPNLLQPEEPTLQYERVPTPEGQPQQAVRIDPVVKKEIEQAITQALSRKGIGGAVLVNENNAELHGVSAGIIAVDVGDWVTQWNLLPADMRDRRAETAAVRLASALGKVVGTKDSGTRWGPLIGKALGFVVTIGAFAAVVWWLDDSGFFGAGPEVAETEATATPVKTGAPRETPAAAKARRERACEAARSRLYSGANMGVDTDGFVVELWLARTTSPSQLSDDPAIKGIAAKSAIDVGVKGDVDVSVRVDETLGGVDSVMVQLKQGFVPPFFETAGRRQMETLARDTAVSVKATHGALYARCAHLRTRDIGGWYYGSTREHALASLMYATGAFVDPPALDVSKLGGPDKTLRALVSKSASSNKTKVDDILRLEGGRWQPVAPDDDPGPTALRFPLGGPTRAGKASRSIGEELSL